jgi:hypothetical protein
MLLVFCWHYVQPHPVILNPYSYTWQRLLWVFSFSMRVDLGRVRFGFGESDTRKLRTPIMSPPRMMMTLSMIEYSRGPKYQPFLRYDTRQRRFVSHWAFSGSADGIEQSVSTQNKSPILLSDHLIPFQDNRAHLTAFSSEGYLSPAASCAHYSLTDLACLDPPTPRS